VLGRLSHGARKAARVPTTIAAALLQEGEVAEIVVAGKVMGQDAIAVLVGSSVLVVNDAELKPFVHRVEVGGDLTVQGWEEGRTASLIFTRDGVAVRIDAISDPELAKEMAGRVRARVGGV